LRNLIESELERVFIREEVIDSQPDKRLHGRFLVKSRAQYVNNSDVPETFFSIDGEKKEDGSKILRQPKKPLLARKSSSL
jgi:hypothetical protein